jgi:hypothetical protein
VLAVTSLLNFDESFQSRTVESIPSYRPATDEQQRKGDRWAQTMRVVSNQKVVRPGLAASTKRCFASAVSPERMSECRQKVLFPHRHAPSCRSCSRERSVLAFLGSLTCKIEEKKERKIVMHIIDEQQVFLFTTIGVQGGEAAKLGYRAAKPPSWGTGRRSRQAPAAKPPRALESDCTDLSEAGGRREERMGVACMLASSCHQA